MESIPAQNTPILVVDDDEGLLLSIRATLISAGLPDPALLSDSRRVLDLLRTARFQIVLLDLIMPHLGGMEVLQQIQDEFPDVDCFIVSAIDDVSTAVKAMSTGASDYLVKPLNSERLVALVQGNLEKHRFRDELARLGHTKLFANLKHPEAFASIIAADEAMALIFHQVEAVAGTDYSVVINGESGTGKEMLARVIHQLSHRSTAPFCAVNMASFSKTLFEDEFFGHAKGAYTDAGADRRGFFEAASGGTLFLDEITELDPALQAKLLRVIEEREFYRLGSTEIRSVDVRIIAATNRDIGEEILNGRFRADLFYRINTYNIKIPPLRERKRDILPLARHFLRIHAKSNRKKIIDIAGAGRAPAQLRVPGQRARARKHDRSRGAARKGKVPLPRGGAHAAALRGARTPPQRGAAHPGRTRAEPHRAGPGGDERQSPQSGQDSRHQPINDLPEAGEVQSHR